MLFAKEPEAFIIYVCSTQVPLKQAVVRAINGEYAIAQHDMFDFLPAEQAAVRRHRKPDSALIYFDNNVLSAEALPEDCKGYGAG
jgi:hypothetical protein